MNIDPNMRICYYDYLGLSRSGSIIFLEPAIKEGPDVYWCYIKDIDDEYNINPINIDGVNTWYAELRLSTEIFEDTD